MYQEALDLLHMTPQHHSYFNRGIDQMLMKVKCLRHLGEFDKAIEEVSRYLLQESYFYSDNESRTSSIISHEASSSPNRLGHSPRVSADQLGNRS
jgi:hypothetical protein